MISTPKLARPLATLARPTIMARTSVHRATATHPPTVAPESQAAALLCLLETPRSIPANPASLAARHHTAARAGVLAARLALSLPHHSPAVPRGARRIHTTVHPGLLDSPIAQIAADLDLDSTVLPDSSPAFTAHVDLFTQTEVGAPVWRGSADFVMDTMNDVPDVAHRGVGTVDEGVDGLREAGYLGETAARHLAQAGSADSHSGLAPPPNHPDGATNLYAMDDTYKDIAFQILDMTERDTLSKLSSLPADHDRAQIATMFTDTDAEIAEPSTGAASTDSAAASAAPADATMPSAHFGGALDASNSVDLSDVSPAIRVHAASLFSEWRPAEVTAAAPTEEATSAGSMDFASSTLEHFHSLARDPSALAPGSRRGMHTMTWAPRRSFSYTYADYLQEVETGRLPETYEALRRVLLRSPDMYSVDDAIVAAAPHDDAALAHHPQAPARE
ncbi:hypothetical protein BC828DRAFT_394317 [Blastocladiella britannica]|nr:hypothetical protein BC828DRAFT_394317 [Blastocladiella britannica]